MRGVMLLDLAPDHLVQGELDLEDDGGEVVERARLMKVMDRLNSRYGKGTVHVGSTGLDGPHREWGNTRSASRSYDSVPY